MSICNMAAGRSELVISFAIKLISLTRVTVIILSPRPKHFPLTAIIDRHTMAIKTYLDFSDVEEDTRTHPRSNLFINIALGLTDTTKMYLHKINCV
jgi:hypothetical protein